MREDRWCPVVNFKGATEYAVHMNSPYLRASVAPLHDPGEPHPVPGRGCMAERADLAVRQLCSREPLPALGPDMALLIVTNARPGDDPKARRPITGSGADIPVNGSPQMIRDEQAKLPLVGGANRPPHRYSGCSRTSARASPDAVQPVGAWL